MRFAARQETPLREKRAGVIRSYRCLLLFSAVDSAVSGGLATIDLDLARLESLDRLDRDRVVRKALVRIFSLALGGISGVEKK
jgi:hypothetical protein